MATWRPTLADDEGPLYLAIVTSIAADVASELNVALTTVTRAYAEAERPRLERALTTLADILERPPAPRQAVV